MKCEKCSSERIQAVSETIQTTEKDGQGLFGFLYFIYIIALLVAFGFLIDGLQKPTSIPLDQIAEILTAIEIIKFTIPALFLTMLLKRIAPFKLETKTKIICLDCGNYWYLQEKEESNKERTEEELKKEPEEESELKLEKEPEHERGRVFIKFIFIILSLFIIGTLIYGFASSCPSNKTPPNLELEETLTGVNVYVEAEDDYDKVEVELQFYDWSGNLAYTTTLTGRDYKEGNTYTLTFSFSLSERFTYSYVEYWLESYS